MGHWNHRVVRHKNGDMEIAEMHYDEKDNPCGWSEATAFAEAEDGLESLTRQVEWFRSALDKGILPATGCQKACCVETCPTCGDPVSYHKGQPPRCTMA